MKIWITHIAKEGRYHIPFNQELDFDFNKCLVKVEGEDHKILNKQSGCPPGSYDVVAYDTRPVGDQDNTRMHKLYTNIPELPDVKDTRFIY